MKQLFKTSVIISLIMSWLCGGIVSAMDPPGTDNLLKSVRYHFYRKPRTMRTRAGFTGKYRGLFQREFLTPDMDVDDPDADHESELLFAGYGLKEGIDPEYIHFSEINSREYEFGYGMDRLSVGEQILYNVGLVLLQMSAVELNRRNN